MKHPFLITIVVEDGIVQNVHLPDDNLDYQVIDWDGDSGPQHDEGRCPYCGEALPDMGDFDWEDDPESYQAAEDAIRFLAEHGYCLLCHGNKEKRNG